MLLKELWIELGKRFGNVATITNTFVVRLKESAKFGEKEKKKLQALSNLCIDVASQIDQLPGLACLNYFNTIRPMLYNLPASICSKWEKQVVELAAKNSNTYPDFKVFASMIEKQSVLRNHPNGTATEIPRKEKEKFDGRIFHKTGFDPLHTVLKGDANMDEEGNEDKYCTFHDSKGHNLPECRAFTRKTLQEKTQWIKQAGLCFLCLLQKR